MQPGVAIRSSQVRSVLISTTTKPYLSRKEAASFLDISVRTLARWENERVGPPRIKARGKVLYRRESLVDWLDAQECRAQ